MNIKMPVPHLRNPDLVEWNNNLSVGIESIDKQHMMLLKMTNDLFLSCLDGENAAKEKFKKSVHKAVDYVRSHFSDEEALLNRIGYPKAAEHKAQHELFVRELINQVKNFEAGLKFVPNSFARFLRDWILTHIAIMDKDYAGFCAKKAAEGVVLPLK